MNIFRLLIAMTLHLGCGSMRDTCCHAGALCFLFDSKETSYSNIWSYTYSRRDADQESSSGVIKFKFPIRVVTLMYVGGHK